MGTLGPKGQVVIDFFQAIFEVIMKMVTGVMWFTPMGVSSVIAGKILGVDNVGKILKNNLIESSYKRYFVKSL